MGIKAYCCFFLFLLIVVLFGENRSKEGSRVVSPFGEDLLKVWGEASLTDTRRLGQCRWGDHGMRLSPQ